LAPAVRRKLGESLATVQKFDVTPENVTTSSLEALKAYSSGMQMRRRDTAAPEIAALFQRAVALDLRHTSSLT